MVEGTNGQLYVRVGGDDDSWQPSFSNYRDYREYTYGNGWKVWVSLPGNPDLRQAPFKDAFSIPQYQDPKTINIPDELVN
jgi:alpha-amylase